MLTGRLVLAYGAERFDLPKIDATFFPVPIWVWAVGFVIAMPVIISTIAHSAAVSNRSIGAKGTAKSPSASGPSWGFFEGKPIENSEACPTEDPAVADPRLSLVP